jgi:hypothetical protein
MEVQGTTGGGSRRGVLVPADFHHFVCGEGVRIDLERAGGRDRELEPTF